MTESHNTPGALTLVSPKVVTRCWSSHQLRRDGGDSEMFDSLEHYERLADYLRGTGAPSVIGLEATGNYHRPLAYLLHHEGSALRLIPTMALARTREAMHNPGTRTTPKTRR